MDSSSRPAPAASGERTALPLDSLAGYAIRRANNRMMADLMPLLAPLGLRPVLFAMLAVIAARPGIIHAALGAELGIQRANLVPLINELKGKALIVRNADPRDRRALTLHLTAGGEALHARAAAEIRKHEERMLARISAADRLKLLDLLARIGTE